MSDGELDQLAATIQARLTRTLWLCGLGTAWLTVLTAGAVVVLLWAR
jgi:hypothetical protein